MSHRSARRLAGAAAVVWVVAGAFIAISAAVLADSVARNVVLGLGLGAVGAGLSWALGRRAGRVVGALLVALLGLGVAIGAGAVFRVAVEGYATFG